jgi:ferritin-like metal-binding protein YciE
MKPKALKSWNSLASESKARRKTKLTNEQIEKLNKIFEEIEKEQEAVKDDSKRKIARQPEV